MFVKNLSSVIIVRKDFMYRMRLVLHLTMSNYFLKTENKIKKLDWLKPIQKIKKDLFRIIFILILTLQTAINVDL